MRRSSTTPGPPAAKEKLRRDRMKVLYSTLASLLHLQPYERMPLPEFLDLATMSLIRQKEHVERLMARKKELEKEVGSGVHADEYASRPSGQGGGLQLVQVTEMDLKLEANLIMMANNKKFGPFHVLSVIEEGGAQVTSSSFSTLGQHTYCTVHAQAIQARLGFDVALIKSRLLELANVH